MKARITLIAALSALSMVGMTSGASATVPERVVGTDAISDWGGGGDLAILGHALGQDFESASIEIKPDAVVFTMKVTYLPSAGGVPEFTRYTWNFEVDDNIADETAGKKFEIDGKFTNYSRGTCDPTSGKCPPPRDPGERPFFLRGNCTTNPGNVTTCEELALLQGVFTPSARTISVTVPATLLGELKPCLAVLPGANLFGGNISAAPSAYFSSSAMPLDTMEVEMVRIPSADPENAPCPEPPVEEF